MYKTTATLITLGFCALAHAQGNDPGAPNVYAITNAKIVTAPGKTIAKGTLVLRDGLIAAVGEKVSVPADARVIDGSGLTLYPGFVNAATRLGMPTDLPKPERGDSYPVAAIQAENTATALLKADSDTFRPYRQLGFGAALTAPATGLLSGTSAVIALTESTDPSALTLRPTFGMHLALGAGGGFGEYPGSLMGQIAATRQALYDARWAANQRDRYERDPEGKPRPNIPRALTALRPVVEKKLPLVIRASSAQEILRALRLAKEFSLTPVIEGGLEAYAVAEELKQAKATVFLSADLPSAPTTAPGEESTETLQNLRFRALAPTTAATLAKLGVPFALTTSAPENFLRNLRKLVAAGLSENDALTAVTLSPAKLLGLDRQLGTLEPGKLANVVAVENDSLFGPKAKLSRIFIEGKPVALTAGGGAAPRSGGPSAAELTRMLPPGVTPQMAVQFLRANPEAGRQMIPPGVTIEQAIAALEGRPSTPAPANTPQAASTEEATAPPPVGMGLVPPLPAPVAPAFVIRHATVWTSGPAGVLKDADVFVRDGKLAAIGRDLKVPDGTTELDGRGKHVTPGMIDCHSHTAVAGSVNEGSLIVTAQCRIEDVLNPDDVNIYRQLAGGTTAANVLHGSANAIGGQNAVVKWRWGADANGLLIQGAPAGIKFALGENPTRSNGGIPTTGNQRYPASRMGVERVIRSKFMEAKDYAAQRKADPDGTRRDLQLDAIVEILEGKRLIHCHSYVSDEILMLIRLADELGFKVTTFQHVLEGYKVADEIAKHGAGGSTFSDWWGYKIEAIDAIPWNGALMTERGVTMSFNSDSSELARRLNYEAAKAVRWGGMKPDEALKLVTINPARQLHIDKQTGSLEPGKDADLVLWSGDPLSVFTVADQTFVDGKLYFDRAADLAARRELDAEKQRLAKALSPAPSNRPAPVASGAPLPALPQLPAAPPVAGGPVTALVGATLHTVSGADIPDGVLVMQGGRITALGAQGQVTIPAGARQVDAKGLHAYPGLINANTTVGTNEIDSRRETQDNRELATFQPELNIAHVVNPDSEAIKVARAEGILNALVLPSGGVLSGKGALIHLDGWTWEEMALSPAAGLLASLPGGGGGRRRPFDLHCDDDTDDWQDAYFQAGVLQPPAGGQRPGGRRPGGPDAAPAAAGENPLQALNDFIDEGRRYRAALLGEANGAPRHDRDPKFDALIPVLEGKVPVYVRAESKTEIERAVAWAQREKLALVIVGGGEADKCVELLVREKVPILLGPVLSLPSRSDAPYDDAFTLPARLAKAGVTFALTTGGDSEKVRNLAHHAAMAAAFGLDKTQALQAITLTAAQVAGVGNRLGSLEVGKDANIVLTTGDILELTSQVRAAFVEGLPVELTSKQSGLYERWRKRPKK